jgi:tetratricopeptide (TPR) repeat protein
MYNDRGGLCLWHVCSPITVNECSICYNGSQVDDGTKTAENVLNIQTVNYHDGQGALIYNRRPFCERPLSAVITNSTISNNALSGLHIRHYGGNPEFKSWKIQGNTICDNGQNVVWNADNNDLMEGANFHAYQDIFDLEFTNNVLGGALSGIYLEYACAVVNDYHTPYELSIYNNIQYGEDDAGIGDNQQTKHGIVIEFLEETADAIYNNVFWDNEISGVELFPAEIAAGRNLEDHEFCNNVIGAPGFDSDEVGIRDNFDDGASTFYNNAFYDLEGENTAGCVADMEELDPEEDVIDADPQFVDAANRDFHLLWSSPLINRGYTNFDGNGSDPMGNSTKDPDMLIDHPDFDDEIQRDGSRNDIGAYGGAYANGTYNFWVPAGTQTFGWDPYCAVTDIGDHDELSNTTLDAEGDRDFLEWDYYRVLDDCEIGYTETFTFGGDEGWEDEWTEDLEETLRSVYFEMGYEEEVDFFVEGKIEVKGESNIERVYFAREVDPIGTDRWNGMTFYQCDLSSYLDYFDHSGSYSGLWVDDSWGSVGQIVMQHFNIHHNNLYGLYSYVSSLHLATVEDNANPDGLWSSIYDNGPDCYAGLKISSNVADEVYVYAINVTGNTYTGLSSGAGVYLYNVAELVFDNVNIIENPSRYGLQVGGSLSTTGLAGHDDIANDIADNGQDAGAQSGAKGAEVYLSAAVMPVLDENDITDSETIGADDGTLIYWANGDPGALEFVSCLNCWWGDDIDDYEEDLKEEWFVPSLDDDFRADPVSAAENDAVADFDYFTRGYNLFREGEYREALTIFTWIVIHEPNSGYAVKAAQYMLTCYVKLDLDLDDLYEFYEDVSERHLRSDNYSEQLLSLVCRRLVSSLMLHERRFEDALSYNEDAMRNSPFAGERIMAEIDYLELDMSMNRARTAGKRSSRLEFVNRIEGLSKQLEGLDLFREPVSTPDKYMLANAYPNPFNSSTTISYDLPEKSLVTLKLFDLSGRELSTLVNSTKDAGSYKTSWDASDLPSGVYICRMQAGEFKNTVKLALIR